ncbi:MAG TPA: microcompartment protein [Lachnospiraceae bacterium]|nr:microcompartment protein [Lachnospiraceae bacterium]
MEEILRVDGGSAPEGTAETEEAVGLLEVFGLVCAFLAADAGCKAGNVRLEVFDKNKPANADALPVPLLVTVKFRGDIEDVTEAMKAAEAVALANSGIVTKHIIPRPTKDTEKMLKISALDKD